jgi:hypothetical protein
MTLHFAYGANMSRSVMAKYAPGARLLGAAELSSFRFVITADGYASVQTAQRQTVHGVLWRLAPRDLVALNGWENVAAGLYRAEMLPVRHAGRRMQALVYVARPRREGVPKPGYLELVLEAAREWEFPESYVDSIARWSPARPLGAGARKLGGFG